MRLFFFLPLVLAKMVMNYELNWRAAKLQDWLNLKHQFANEDDSSTIYYYYYYYVLIRLRLQLKYEITCYYQILITVGNAS